MVKDEYKSLKIFVYLMGVIMIGGMLVITYSICKFLFKEADHHHCEPANIELPQKILNANLEKDKLTLLLAPHDKQQTVMVIDYCHGDILNKIDIRIKSE